MKASEYIIELKKLIDEYGDLEVCYQAFVEEQQTWITFKGMPAYWHRGLNKQTDCFGYEPDGDEE